MGYYCLYLILIVDIVGGVPQIFEQNHQFCEYNFTNGHHIRVPSKLWKISKPGFTIQYNLCPDEPLPECSHSTSCLIRNKPKQMIKLGTRFVPVDSDDMILASINGQQCPEDPTIPHKLTINLICSNSIKLAPRLMTMDDCNYEIQMLSPDCTPKCTGWVDDQHLLDLRQFPKNLQITTEDQRTFSLSVCGTNNRCGSSDISSCQLLNQTIIPLSKTDSQLINYDASKGELTARGRYKSGKVSTDVQILIKCNWNKTATNLEYKKLQIQGRHYKFELESSYGCVKLPQTCYLNNVDGLKYNFQQLYRQNNDWIVRKTPVDYGRIALNLCGPLSQSNNKNQCSDQYSQICGIKSGKYTNFGSLPRYEIVSYGVVKVVMNDGGRCDDYKQINYKTEILLKCSTTIEHGPVYKNTTNCTIIIEWSTPHACPLQYYEGDNCLVNDHYGPRNLQQLHQQIDKVQKLDGNNRIVYNLCGPIHRNCSHYANVSFCLLTNQQQHVLGWDTRRLISDYGQLRLDMHGDLCPNRRDSSRILINFVCDYSEPPPQIDIIQDRCKFNLTIYTKSACLSDANFDNCRLSTNDGGCYDLSPLIRKNHNYIIDDGDAQYALNLCGPIVTNRKALCKKNAMLCLLNKTESNIKQQFKAIGSVIGPQFKNNSLQIETIGDYCPGYGFYKSRIIFECTPTRDELPKLLQKDKCSYLFLWKTRYACQQQHQCYIPNTSINLKNLTNTKLEVHLENSLINRFDLCDDIYEECNNGTCIEKQLQRQITIKEAIVYVKLNLTNKTCTESRDFHTVVFKLLCDDKFDNNEHLENESLNDCILTQIIRTQLICSLNNNNNNNNITSTNRPTTKEETIKENESHHYYYTNIENCLITDNNNRPIILNNLPGFSTIFQSTKYTINLNQSIHNCFGLFCINDTVVVPFATNCPHINRNDDGIQLEFASGTVCQDKLINNVDMVLKCGGFGVNIINNSNCRIQIEYSLPSICEEVSTSSVSTTVGGIIGGCVLFIAIVVLIYKLRLQCCRNRQYLDLTAMTPFYLRDCDV